MVRNRQSENMEGERCCCKSKFGTKGYKTKQCFLFFSTRVFYKNE